MKSLRQSHEDGAPALVSTLRSLASLVDHHPTVFRSTDAVRPDVLMSKEAYRARARDLTMSADALPTYDLILEAESLAAAWRELAILADLQDSLSAALAATRD